MAITCPQEPSLGPDPVANTTAIEQITLASGGGHARIPKGTFSVNQIRLGSNSRISGCGIGLSELTLAGPSSGSNPASVIVTSAAGNAEQMVVNDLTLNGNDVDDANGSYALILEGCQDSIFRNIEIKNCRTGGIYIKEWENPANPSGNKTPSDCILNGIIISRCGRYGVLMNSGNRIQLNRFLVTEIGIGDTPPPGSDWPKAALDIKPIVLSPSSLRTSVSDVIISDWNVSVVGQGILIRAEDAMEAATGIVLANINCNDIRGNNMLLFRNVASFAGNNINCQHFDASQTDSSEPAGGVRFDDAKGSISGLTVIDVADAGQANYPIKFIGNETEVSLSGVMFKDFARGVIECGNNDSASGILSDFTLEHVTTQTNFIPITVNSTGDVRFIGGTVREIVLAQRVCRLEKDAAFEFCNFEIAGATVDTIFDNNQNGRAFGSSNNWNKVFNMEFPTKSGQ